MAKHIQSSRMSILTVRHIPTLALQQCPELEGQRIYEDNECHKLKKTLYHTDGTIKRMIKLNRWSTSPKNWICTAHISSQVMQNVYTLYFRPHLTYKIKFLLAVFNYGKTTQIWCSKRTCRVLHIVHRRNFLHQYSEPSSPNLVVNDQYRILILIYLSATVASILMFCSEYTFYYNHICQF